MTRIVTEVLKDNPASLAMLRRLGEVSLQDEGNGVYGVVVELSGAAVPPPPSPAPGRRSAPLLRDPQHRRALHARDQVCPWFH